MSGIWVLHWVPYELYEQWSSSDVFADGHLIVTSAAVIYGSSVCYGVRLMEVHFH